MGGFAQQVRRAGGDVDGVFSRFFALGDPEQRLASATRWAAEQQAHPPRLVRELDTMTEEQILELERQYGVPVRRPNRGDTMQTNRSDDARAGR